MPPKVQGNPNLLGLTPREAEIALLAWMCLEADNKINAGKLAHLAKIGKPESASRMWRMIKAKIEKALTSAPGDGNTAAAEPSQPEKKKAAAGAGKKRTKQDMDADDDASADADKSDKEGKPKKKAAKRVKKEEPKNEKKDSEPDADMEDLNGDDEAGEV